jgi:glycosyltransferase involved in cell wall biosynthesis
MILSILIPTTPDRAHHLRKIKAILEPQITRCAGQVELLINDRGRRGQPHTGEKRNELIRQAQGDYTVFVDDDDWLPDFYVSEILKAAASNPDCITFRGWMTTDGRSRVNFVLRMGERYEERNGKYYRFPNHITPITRSITSKIKFSNISQGEDYLWAKEINNLGLIKSEVFIDKDMYHYDYQSRK